MTTQLLPEMTAYAKKVEELLSRFFRSGDSKYKRIEEAMRYSALSGGKRIRPYLTMKTAEALQGDLDVALYFAVALEMVHTYSLIHDDLPCMDDDDFRRGKLTCHKMYDEALALLAGDGLLTRAFYVIAISPASDQQKVAATVLLADCAGHTGMIGGQVMDLAAEHMSVELDTLQSIYSGKTAALMRAAVGLGCIASVILDGDIFSAFSTFAEEVGIAFQIQDDILDVYGTYALGKPLGSDEKNGKSTYLTFMSQEEAESEARLRTTRAKSAIQSIAGTEMLIALADYLLGRNK